MAKICITGSAGYIGAELTARLKLQKHQVMGVDIKNGEAEDICLENCRTAIRDWKPQIIYNLAAIVGEKNAQKEKWEKVYEVNVLAPALLNMDFKGLFIQMSTASVLEAVESKKVKDRPYAFSKKLSEKLLMGKFNNFIICRLGTVYGEAKSGQTRWELPINRMVKDLYDTKIAFCPNKRLWRPWIHIYTLVDFLTGLTTITPWKYPIPVCSRNMPLDLAARKILGIINKGTIEEKEITDNRSYKMPAMITEFQPFEKHIQDLWRWCDIERIKNDK